MRRTSSNSTLCLDEDIKSKVMIASRIVAVVSRFILIIIFVFFLLFFFFARRENYFLAALGGKTNRHDPS